MHTQQLHIGALQLAQGICSLTGQVQGISTLLSILSLTGDMLDP